MRSQIEADIGCPGPQLRPFVAAFAAEMERRLVEAETVSQGTSVDLCAETVPRLINLVQLSFRRLLEAGHDPDLREVLALMADCALCCAIIAKKEGAITHEVWKLGQSRRPSQEPEPDPDWDPRANCI